MNSRFPLLALAVGAFGIGTTEFAPMGLLPVIADNLELKIPTAGLLITAYAAGVTLGAPIITIATRHVPRHVLLIAMMAIFTAGNILAALSSGFATLLLARVVTSMAHGTFFGVGSIVAANLVPADRRASAVATMFMGLTIATIGGVPLATWIGEIAGWRAAFAGTSLIGALAMMALWYALPRLPAESQAEISHEFRTLTRGTVVQALLTTVLSAGSMFTFMTYIAPFLSHQAHSSDGFITAILVLVGTGFTVGNLLGGKFADRSLTATLVSFLCLLGVVLVLMPLATGSALLVALAIFVWGVASFAVVPPLQMRVMATAKDAPNLASSVNIGAFNLGNALGALVGGLVLDAGLSYAWIPPAGALLCACALFLVLAGRKTLSVDG